MFVFLCLIIRDESCLRFIPKWEMSIKLLDRYSQLVGQWMAIMLYSSLPDLPPPLHSHRDLIQNRRLFICHFMSVDYSDIARC